jgi:CheY-like chemotaxis protein
MARILIADDDRELAEAWRAELERAGHEVVVKVSGLEALTSAHREPPDIVIAELIMPGIGGLALAGRIKLIGADVKVIVTTGHAAILDAVVDGLSMARRAGADVTLAKPLTPSVLARAVRDLLAPPPDEGAASGPDRAPR